MKKLILFITLVSISTFNTYGQEKTKIKEFGITTANFKDLGLTYRFGHEKSLWRLNVTSSSLERQTISDLQGKRVLSSIDLKLKFGKEWRHTIGKMFEVRYGADIRGLYNSFKRTEDYYTLPEENYQRSIYGVGLDGMIGFNVVFAEHIVLGGEYSPGLDYSWSRIEQSPSTGETIYLPKKELLSLNLNPTGVFRLSLLYRF